jgi:hypothetical protein
MKKLALLLLCFSLNSYSAEEVDSLCDLHKAKAELTSSLLSSPYIYGSNNENSTATVAIGYSLAGRVKGNLTKEIAAAKCESLAVTTLLDEQQRWTMVSIGKSGAKAELIALLSIRDKAREVLELSEQQLKSQTVTINEYTAAKQILLGIDSRIFLLRTILAEPSQPVDIGNINILLGKARSSEGLVAELTAKVEAENSWDVVLAAGAQKDLAVSGSSTSPFVGLNFRWSFSGMSTKDSIAKIKDKTEIAFSSAQGGYVKTADRLIGKIEELLLADKSREQVLQDNISDTDRILVSFKNVNSALANNTKRALEIQNGVYRAELLGVKARIEKYSGIKN